METNRSPLVKGLTPRLPERGKIKIGIKGQWIKSSKGNEFQPPQKLDHFLITRTVRDGDKTANFIEDTELMDLLKKEHADADGKLRRIPIRLLFNDVGLNVQTRYASYKGRKTLFCTGDGELATRNYGKNGFTEIECPCKYKDPEHQKEHQDDPRCKIATRFQCEIVGCEEVGGVFIFRSTSYNTGIELPSSLQYLSVLTSGILIGLDLMLVMAPRTKEQGNIHVVSVIYPGSRTELKEAAIKLLESDTVYNVRHNLVEARARKMLVANNELEEYIEEITEEHYPEEAKKEPPSDAELEDTVDKETGEIQEEGKPPSAPPEPNPKPTKAELTEAYYNDHYAELCMEKQFGGLKFSDLKKKDKNWVYDRMTSPPTDEGKTETVDDNGETVT
ncbi:hypothetical protein LCGC14_1425380, partial [marine sediment metagenome]